MHLSNMAASKTKTYPQGSPQQHIVMCEFHDSPIDVICEDCDEFICGDCAKSNHRDHNWKTLTAAAIQRRRGLLNYLKKIKEEDLAEIDEKMAKIPQQITENEEMYDSQIKKLQKHCEEIMARLAEIRKSHEKTFRDNLVTKNEQLNLAKSELERKKKEIVETLDFIEENNSAMSDYSLIDNHKKMTKMLSELEIHMTNCEHSVRFTRGKIDDELLESMLGKTLDLDNTGLTQINSFQYGDKIIYVLEALSEEKCYIKDTELVYTEKVNKEGAKEQKFIITPNDICVTDKSDVYFTDGIKKSIRCLSPSGSVSTVLSTSPLEPWGICQSVNVDSGLLVTLMDNKSEFYMLNSHSRRLVRHITVTGDVIREYEYQEDGQTRLFTSPYSVTQNSNSDICVVNHTSNTTGVIVIMSPFGQMRSSYDGQILSKNFNPTDVVCDSLCNILVIDSLNKQIHLLSPNGEFLKFLLTENEVNFPTLLSLYKSTLWVGYEEGVVKLFHYSV